MIENKLYTRLKSVAANVYPVVAPVTYQRPCVVYNRTGTETERNIDDDPQTCGWVTFQVDVYALTLLESKTLARTIRASLKAWVDADISAVTWVNELDMVDDTTDVSLYRTMTSYRVFVVNGI